MAVTSPRLPRDRALRTESNTLKLQHGGAPAPLIERLSRPA
jgi:hypothetical protein